MRFTRLFLLNWLANICFMAGFFAIAASAAAAPQALPGAIVAPKGEQSLVVIKIKDEELLKLATDRLRRDLAAATPDVTLSDAEMERQAKDFLAKVAPVDFNLVYGRPSGSEVVIVGNMNYVRDPEDGEGYFYINVKPGKFVLYGFNIQGFWMIDWAGRAAVFDIPAKSVVQLGEFDPSASRAKIFRLIEEKRMHGGSQTCYGGCTIAVNCNQEIEGYTAGGTGGVPSLPQFMQKQLKVQLPTKALQPTYEAFKAKSVAWTYPAWACIA